MRVWCTYNTEGRGLHLIIPPPAGLDRRNEMDPGHLAYVVAQTNGCERVWQKQRKRQRERERERERERQKEREREVEIEAETMWEKL